MAIRALVCAAAIALLCASPAMAADPALPTSCTSQPWQCDRCATVPNVTVGTITTLRFKCWDLVSKGYNVDVVVACALLTDDAAKTACLTGCFNSGLPVGQEWRCAKCMPSPDTIKDRVSCFNTQGNVKVGSDDIARCSSLPLADYASSKGTRCNTCLVNVLGSLGQYNDWRCIKCTDAALLATGMDGARDSCYKYVSGKDTDSGAAATLVSQVNDVVTCSKETAANLRCKCYKCLEARTATGTTWACMSCLYQANKSTCLDGLADTTSCASV